MHFYLTEQQKRIALLEPLSCAIRENPNQYFYYYYEISLCYAHPAQSVRKLLLSRFHRYMGGVAHFM